MGLHNIASRLVRRGHRPVVITARPHVKRLRRYGWQLPYPVTAFPAKTFGILRYIPALGFLILDRFFAGLQRRYAFDVWHGTVGYPVGAALVHFAAARRIPHLVRCAGEDIQTMPEIGYGMRLDPAIDAMVKRWLPGADAVVAITEAVAEEYRAIGVAEERIVCIPNGVDLDRFRAPLDRASLRLRLGIPQDALVFLNVGRNHPKKGLLLLLEAFARMRQEARLIVAGPGVLGLADAARRLGVADRVSLREMRHDTPWNGLPEMPPDEIVALYRAADVFVMPSLIETFGIVIVEAMAARLPVITFDAPGSRDVVRGARDALVVPSGDTVALAAAMDRLCGDAELRAEYAARAERRAEAFSWESVVDRYVDLYESLIARRDSRSAVPVPKEAGAR